MLPEAKRLAEDIINIINKLEKRQRGRKADEVLVFNSTVSPIIYRYVKSRLVAINGVFKREYSLLFQVNFPSVLTNFILTLIEFNY